MTEGGFFERKRISPTGAAIVILLHGAAITALAMAKMDMPVMKVFEPLKIDHVAIEPDPPEIPPEPVNQQQPVPRETQIDYVPPVVPTVPKGPVILHDPALDPPVFDPSPPIKAEPRPAEPRPVPPPEPVRVTAQMRSGDLQPPYPLSEERAGIEGRVSIRVTIGADGRVKKAEKVSATNDAFYRATERHALRAWRFRPATVDGRPVESRQVISVDFRLTG